MKDEKVTWESTGITYPTYLPPGVRYHRGPSSTSLSPPPPLVPAFASASRYLCKTEAGTDQVRQHPRSHLLLYTPSPSCASINPLDRTRGRRIKRSIPSTLPGPDQRRSAKIQVVAPQVGSNSHPHTRTPGQEQALASKCCVFWGCIHNLVFRFWISRRVGCMVWFGR